MLPLLLRLLLIAGLGAMVYALLRYGFRRQTKCSTCRHCVKEFNDGTLCGFGNNETFKNPVHVGNCVDWSQRPRRPAV